jgi:undecaprenyl-diphosphatase
MARALSALGSGWIMVAVVPLYGVARWRRFGLWLTGTVASTATLVFLVKVLVGRARPFQALPDVRALCAMPTDASFPSGHSCGGFTVAGFLMVSLYAGGADRRAHRAAVALVLLLLAVGIAWSRVYLGVHFPSDVLAGAVLGGLAGGLSARRMERTRKEATEQS